MKRFWPASFAKVIAPPGNSLPSPAFAGNSVTLAGRLATAQCQKPDAVGASGSYMVTAKLRVSSGNPDQLSCGETSSPPAPKIPLTWALASGSPSVMDSEVSVKPGSSGRKEYGSYGNAMGVFPFRGRVGQQFFRKCSRTSVPNTRESIGT